MPNRTLQERSSIADRPDRTITRFIDPNVLMRIKSLELRAKTVVEGFWNGLHRSPYQGFSVEFTEYRQYTPGDDPRYIDWHLYARSDRFYVKRFEDETNLRCHLLLDASRSMSYGSLDYTKYDYARTLVASLAYFLVSQRDAAGLVTFDATIRERVPARYRPGHLRHLLSVLEAPADGGDTDFELPLEQIAQLATKRGMMILVSDLLANIDSIETHLGYLTASGHEVIVMQLLDPAELHLTLDEPALMRDLETGREVYVDPESARTAYIRRIEEHCSRIRTSCDRLGITFHQFATDAPLELMLLEFLLQRTRTAKKQARSYRRTG